MSTPKGKTPSRRDIDTLRWNHMGRLFLDAQRAFSRRAMAALAARGHGRLKRSHGDVLPHIPADGIGLTELADRAGMTKQSMGEIVRDLVAAGYLRRRKDPNDQRAIRITFTATGRQLLGDIYAVLEQENRWIVESLGARRAAMLDDLLLTLVRHYDVDAAEAGPDRLGLVGAATQRDRTAGRGGR